MIAYRGANGVIVVFDVTNRDSFNNVSTWLEQIDKHTVPGEKVIKILVGNKSDMTALRTVPYETAKVRSLTTQLIVVSYKQHVAASRHLLILRA